MKGHHFDLTKLDEANGSDGPSNHMTMQKYRAEMAQLGFQQANVLVHDADRTRVLAYVKKIQGQRLIDMLAFMRETKDYSEKLDNLAQRRSPRGMPRLEQVARIKSTDKRTLTRLAKLTERVQKVADAKYDCARKVAELKQGEGHPELYYLYDEIAMLSAEVYAYGLWAASEWALLQEKDESE